MKNKKAFTLTELLAVIVILGVLLGIAVPQVTKYITKSRKESFVSAGKLFIEAVRNDATSEMYALPINSNDVTIVTLDKADFEKASGKSSFGGKYIYNKSYVAIINIGTGVDPEYKYYFAVQDTKDYAIALTEETKVSVDGIVAKAKNKMEVTIQSLCGTDEGYNKTYSTISGLDSVQPTSATGTRLDWNATIYSSSECSTNNE